MKNKPVRTPSPLPSPSFNSLGVGFADEVAIMTKGMMVQDAVKRETGITIVVKYTGGFPIIQLQSSVPVVPEKCIGNLLDDYNEEQIKQSLAMKQKILEVRHSIGNNIRAIFGVIDSFPMAKTKRGFFKYECKLIDSKGDELPLLTAVIRTNATCYDSDKGIFLCCYETKKGHVGKGICPCGMDAPTQTSEPSKLDDYFPFEER